MAVENQHLKHGKALCGKVFARFVETFNALVDFMLGMRGDADGKNGEGHITFDRSNPAHPVIRCDGCAKKGSGGGGDESGVTSLNEQDGDMQIVGGSKIDVSTEGKTIRIDFNENKEADDDPCEHPGGGGGASLDGYGGASLDGPSTHGNPCNSCD